jgi:hypothetical protein
MSFHKNIPPIRWGRVLLAGLLGFLVFYTVVATMVDPRARGPDAGLFTSRPTGGDLPWQYILRPFVHGKAGPLVGARDKQSGKIHRLPQAVANWVSFIHYAQGILNRPDLTSAARMARDKKGRIYVWETPAKERITCGTWMGRNLPKPTWLIPSVRRYDANGKVDKSFLVRTILYFYLQGLDAVRRFPNPYHRHPTSDDVLGVCFSAGSGCHAVNRSGRWRRHSPPPFQRTITHGKDFHIALSYPPLPLPNGILCAVHASQGWMSRAVTIETPWGLTALFFPQILAIGPRGDVAFVVSRGEPRPPARPGRAKSPTKVMHCYYVLPTPDGGAGDAGPLRPILTKLLSSSAYPVQGEFLESPGGSLLVWWEHGPTRREFFRWENGVLSSAAGPEDPHGGVAGVFIDPRTFAYPTPQGKSASPIQISRFKLDWEPIRSGLSPVDRDTKQPVERLS